jgi:hypothetical protein
MSHSFRMPSISGNLHPRSLGLAKVCAVLDRRVHKLAILRRIELISLPMQSRNSDAALIAISMGPIGTCNVAKTGDLCPKPSGDDRRDHCPGLAATGPKWSEQPRRKRNPRSGTGPRLEVVQILESNVGGGRVQLEENAFVVDV